MVLFTQLKQRKGKFQKRHLYENVQPRSHSRHHLVCLEWGTLGAKVNSEQYCEHVLKRVLLPVFQATCGHHSWTLQHNGAPSYTVRNTIDFLRARQVASKQSRLEASRLC